MLFKNKTLELLEKENAELREENLELIRKKHETELKLFKLFGREWIEEVNQRLELTELQRAKFEIICSVEHARLAGVPEDRILKDIKEVEEFFTN